MFTDYFMGGNSSSKGDSVKVFFHYLFYTGAVLFSVSIMVGTENGEFQTTTIATMIVGSILIVIGAIGGRRSKR